MKTLKDPGWLPFRTDMTTKQLRIIEANPQHFSSRTLAIAEKMIVDSRSGGPGCQAFARAARLAAFGVHANKSRGPEFNTFRKD